MGNGAPLRPVLTAADLPEVRRRIDQARRERIALEALIEAERELPQLCAHCGAPIPLERIGAGRWPTLYCQPNHRQYAYYRRKRAVAAA